MSEECGKIFPSMYCQMQPIMSGLIMKAGQALLHYDAASKSDKSTGHMTRDHHFLNDTAGIISFVF
jgi:hypothetical protein